MSTRIKTIKGRYDTVLHINRFCGGKENGRMIQLTIYNNEGSTYVQLTRKQVKKLSKILKNAFNDNKYPSE